MKQSKGIYKPLAIEVVRALLRYGILSVQVGIAAGAIVIALACASGCAGYAEGIWASAAGLLAAFTTAISLLIRHMSIRQSPPRLKREASWQWIWIAATLFISMAFL